MLMNHDELREGMNVDELCEVFASFVFANGLEQEADECEQDAGRLLAYTLNWAEKYGKESWQDEITSWLERYIEIEKTAN